MKAKFRFILTVGLIVEFGFSKASVAWRLSQSNQNKRLSARTKLVQAYGIEAAGSAATRNNSLRDQ